jgi:hypothetical protein
VFDGFLVRLKSMCTKVINSGGSGRNCGRNNGSGPLPQLLQGSALNFAVWNFAAAILNSGAILRPQLHVASHNSVEANNPYADGDGSSDHEADDVIASNNDNE